MTNIVQLTRRQKKKREKRKPYLPGVGPEGPGPSSPCTGKGGKEDSNVAPFRTTRLAAYTYLLSNVMWFKRFLLLRILTLADV